MAGVSTVYIAGVYAQSGAASTSYYEGGAMRRSGYTGRNGVFYLLTDHLKSTSIIADQAGAEAALQFFYPYGGNRGGAGFSQLTTKRFTGQYHEQGLPGAEGLSYYNARWYDPQLGRFTSPDTIVPKPDSPQAINRYSYGYNNPPTNLDTSGHAAHKAGTEVWNKERIRALVAKSMEILRKQVKPRIYYLNGLGGNKDLQPSSNPVAEYEYTYYKLQQYGGSAQVVHIPLFTDGRSTRWQRLEMLQEAFLSSKPWTDIAVKMISDGARIARPQA